MSDDDLMKVWVGQCAAAFLADDIVAAISARWSEASGEERYELARQLDIFLSIAGRHDEALQLLTTMMGEFPDDVGLRVNKAIIYLYPLQDFEKALEWIDRALELAYRSGESRREVLGYKARILLKLGRGDQLSDVLEEIMSLRIAKGALDIGRQRDFVDRAPPGMIRKDVLERYNAFRPRRAGDTLDDMPPRYELPDDAA